VIRHQKKEKKNCYMQVTEELVEKKTIASWVERHRQRLKVSSGKGVGENAIAYSAIDMGECSNSRSSHLEDAAFADTFLCHPICQRLAVILDTANGRQDDFAAVGRFAFCVEYLCILFSGNVAVGLCLFPSNNSILAGAISGDRSLWVTALAAAAVTDRAIAGMGAASRDQSDSLAAGLAAAVSGSAVFCGCDQCAAGTKVVCSHGTSGWQRSLLSLCCQ